MNPDTYTKVVLGVIAASLIYYVLRTEQAVSPLFGTVLQPVVQTETQSRKASQVMSINLAEIDGVPISSRLVRPHDEAVPVRIVNLPP